MFNINTLTNRKPRTRWKHINYLVMIKLHKLNGRKTQTHICKFRYQKWGTKSGVIRFYALLVGMHTYARRALYHISEAGSYKLVEKGCKMSFNQYYCILNIIFAHFFYFVSIVQIVWDQILTIHL